ncbi:MAG: sugar-transfer associated ATP-grasp domain-containing protein [Bacillota bacterium]|nr:sugar-transfer associated ATP-grasp domain-containing protein [Bacillota bacterium]
MASKMQVLMSRVFSANYKELIRMIKDDAKKSGKSFLTITADSLTCMMRYGTAINDYHLFEFWRQSPEEREKFITLTYNNKIVSTLNDISLRPVFEAKSLFADKFKNYFGRDVLQLKTCSQEMFEEFCGKHPVFFAKKDYEFGGHGVERFTIDGFKNLKDAYDKLKESGYDLLEEVLQQHPELNEFYDCLNTVRIATLLTDEGPKVVYAVFRCGNGGYVDNVGSGGFAVTVDPESGEIISDAIKQDGSYAEYHPVSKKKFRGSKIPMWDEAIAMVKEAALKCPRVRYVGWDVAFTPDKCVLIEGNYNPGYQIFQMIDKKGRKYFFEGTLDK